MRERKKNYTLKCLETKINYRIICIPLNSISDFCSISAHEVLLKFKIQPLQVKH